MLMEFIANLSWYDLPSVRFQVDAFWTAVAQHMTAVGYPPVSQLDRSTPLSQLWRNPQLALGQCCGLDLFTPAAQELVVLARPVFDTAGCEPGQYFSHIIARDAPPPTTCRIAVNSLSSRSGFTALLEWMQRTGRQVAKVVATGSHQASLAALRNGKVDLAAIDAHTSRLLGGIELTTVGVSSQAPAPPFVMHRRCAVPREIVLGALHLAVEAVGKPIGIVGLVECDETTYLPMHRQTQRLGGELLTESCLV